MFVKLQWTQDKHISQIFKLITYIVNTPAVASVTNITTALTDSLTFNSQASIYAGWDPANSYIYRTGTGNNALTTTNTTARFGKVSAAVYGWNFWLEQTAYDNSNHKTLYSINSHSATLTASNVYSSHRLSTAGSLISGIASEATTTNSLNSAGQTATGYANSGLGTGTTFPVTVSSTTVTTNVVTLSSAPPIPLCKGMRFIVTGTTYGGLTAGTYTIVTISSATAFTVTSADYVQGIAGTATTLSTYTGPFTGATYSLEVAAVSEQVWDNGSANSAGRVLGTSTSIENTIRTAWFYITDNCFLWAVANSTGGTTGLPASTNLTLTNYTGPHFQAQYTRTDPWNTSSNGVIPWVMSNPYRQTVGTHFGAATTDLTNVANTGSANGVTTLPLLACTKIFAIPSTTATSWPKYYYQPVSYGAGARYNDIIGLTQSGTANPAAYSTTAGSSSNIAGALFTSAGVRWWSADLTKKTYMMLPITWRDNYYNVSGGNITDRTGIYWFNGDYYPGDTLTYNSKTYVLLPLGLCANDSYRVAFAIPRE